LFIKVRGEEAEFSQAAAGPRPTQLKAAVLQELVVSIHTNGVACRLIWLSWGRLRGKVAHPILVFLMMS